MKSLPSARPIVRPLMTRQEVAKLLNVDPRTIDNLVRSGSLSSVRFNRCVRFEPEAVDQLVETYRKGPRLSSHVAV